MAQFIPKAEIRPRVPVHPSTGRSLPRLPARMTSPVAHSPFAPGVDLSIDPIWLLARRACHAATADQVARISALGPTAWLEAQLSPESIDDSACESFISAKFPLVKLTIPQLSAATDDQLWHTCPQLARAITWRQLTTRRPLLERVVELWHDHLHVALDSDKAYGYLCAYDRLVIRPKALGRFADLLYAAVTHPAMLRYLDNADSTKHHPNENLAREVLELHTIGVDAYTEDDVAGLSRLLTGYSVDEESGMFVYRSQWHAVGPVTVAGFSHPNATASAGPVALRALLEHLAVHPATVRRVIGKVATRFVSDQPSTALVSRLSAVYLENDTSIAPVLRALFTSAEFQRSTGQKWARPQELLATMFGSSRPAYKAPKEATDLWAPMGTYHWLLDRLGHTPLSHPTPDGPKDVGAAWNHAAGLLGQWNVAEAVAGHWDETLTAKPWTTVLGLTSKMTYLAVAERMFTRLTGYTPAIADRDAVAAFLFDTSLAAGVPGATVRIGADELRWNIDEAVRLVLSSPYMGIR